LQSFFLLASIFLPFFLLSAMTMPRRRQIFSPFSAPTLRATLVLKRLWNAPDRGGLADEPALIRRAAAKARNQVDPRLLCPDPGGRCPGGRRVEQGFFCQSMGLEVTLAKQAS